MWRTQDSAPFGVPIGSLVMRSAILRGYIPPERKYLRNACCRSNTIQFAGTKKALIDRQLYISHHLLPYPHIFNKLLK